ncbi:MAG: sigma factor-like helix-turn-helix DNA-binding protein [Rhodoferax sp.]|nr:sigma factor-like helix-turn-helix DNA-binding protein [Rhodoferax sp.]
MNCLNTAWKAHAAELRGWLRQGERFCALTNARAWLFEVARNLVELPDDLKAKPEDVATVDVPTGCLPRVLSELSMDDREAITLCDLQGLPQADYAQRIGLSLGAAQSCVQRARVRLRAQISTACQVTTDDTGRVSDFVPRI